MNKKLLFLFLSLQTTLFSYEPSNLFRPHDVDFRLYEWKNNDLRFGALVEDGDANKSRNWDSDKVNTLQIYNPQESSIGMLLGAPRNSRIDKLAKSLGVSSATITQDDYRGRFNLTGDFKATNYTFFTRYKLPINIEGLFELALFVPLKSIEFHNICWSDQTRDILSADKEFKESISGRLEQAALDLGSLDVNANGFSKSGLGDISLILSWQKDYKQLKKILKMVRVNASVGVTIPTGEKKDVDQALAQPLGNDGAWGIPASIGLDLNFVYNLRAGINIDILGLFDTTDTYRMKTSTHQTDFLLLHKGEATKSQGTSWQFTLFGQAKRLFAKGLSGMVSYHFFKHDEDRLTPKSYNFDHSIVNSAESLKEWAHHNFVFRLSYALHGWESDKSFKPQISIFYKLPIAGKRSITCKSIGGQISFSF